MTAGIIGERENALLQLRTGEADFKALIEDNPALICRFHVDGRLGFANETFRRAFAIEYGMSRPGRISMRLSGLANDGKFLMRLHERGGLARRRRHRRRLPGRHRISANAFFAGRPALSGIERPSASSSMPLAWT